MCGCSGKTNTPEFGHRGRRTMCPLGLPVIWNLDHTPGGSSGGSAAASAAGIVPLCHRLGWRRFHSHPPPRCVG
ncbi:MAG: amidase family protein [Candidatus Azotimanducaceae bacterium WSBS_2022_MAG_OTU7]